MSEAVWIALGSFALSIGIALVTGTIGVRKLSENIQTALDLKIDKLKDQLVQAEMVYERRVAQTDAGLRAQIHEVEFYVRDNYVKEPVFQQMIQMLSDNSGNQFKSMQTQLDRIFDKLDHIKQT